MSVDEKGTRPALGDAQLLEQQVIERHVAKDKEPDAPSSESGDGDGEKKEKAAEGSVKDFVRIFRYADRLDVILYVVALVASVASGAALPLMSIIFGAFATKFNDFSLGNVSPDTFKKDISHYTLWFIYLFVARLVVSYVANVCVSIAAVRTTRAVREAVLQSTLRQEIWHFDKETNGSIATQVTTNGDRINQGISDKLATAVQALSLFFSAFIVALAVQWKLSLITMSIIPAIFIINGVLVPIDVRYESRIVRIYSRAAVLAQEALSSIKTVHAFWAHDKIVQKYDEFLSEAHKIGLKRGPLWGAMFAGEYFCVRAGTSLSFWQGASMYRSGEIPDVGTVFTVVLSVTIGATAISMIAPQLLALSAASSAAAELFSIIDKESLLDPLSTEGEKPDSCHGEIEIRDLCFTYPSRPTAQVLHGLSLSIPAGKTTALVGASGCGKSTLVGLLERWYDASSGQVLLDGKTISDYNTKWLRSHVRLVQQEPVLFRGTIFENVSKGFIGPQLELSREKQMELVQEACRASNAHEFIMDLPGGYETQVGERASMLSGGQKQRLAIARSIISDPKILLLDEATSALDPRAEALVQGALNRVSVDRTTLIIAHKLATVKAADNIVVMSQGRVVEQGTHGELLAKDAHYAALVRAQDLHSGGDETNFAKEQEDRQLERHQTMETANKTGGPVPVATDPKVERLTGGTVGYSLVKCIAIMLYESKNAYHWLAIGFISCLIGGGVYPAQALLFSHLIHVFTLTGAAAREQANFYALMLFVVALANFIAYFVTGWVGSEISQILSHRYRREMMENLISLDQDFFDRPENSSGALTSKLTSHPDALQNTISINLFLILIVIVNVVASTCLAIAYGWKLGLVVVFGGLPVLIGCGSIRIRLEFKFQAETDERFAESAAIATEAVTSIRTVASLTLEEDVFRHYAEILDKIVASSTRSFLSAMMAYSLAQSLEFLVMALGFWYGSRLIADGEYTVSQFYVIFIAVVFGGQAAGQFFGYSTSISKAKSAANYILWLRTLKADISEDKTNEAIGPQGDGPLGLEHVEFQYRQRDSVRVLKGIDMKVEPGSYVACVGPSGCGKSTLISLLERFYDPTAGCITLNEQPVKEMSPRLYRNHMSLVQQEPTLYQGSVRENIVLGLQHEASDDEIYEACRQANALEFISSLSEGLATPCGTKGLQFSGGQRQRIAIARALIRQPRLLLLDEATSALDTQSERLVQKTLDEAAASRTTIAVAHRLSTIRHADVIFVFANGSIAEMGTHEELQRLRGKYYEMCLAQSLDRS
ncbi:related to multidrug resistance protein [Phialocephala subalpina]|uniref:Related to multidrug resistance protein n=1 Tax=Phialocephala subalpina TaxID=576137 RepID=A0A1L7WIM7_9HELO|nr:related to multidrug resistance protein [Phialocephala subalpina]